VELDKYLSTSDKQQLKQAAEKTLDWLSKNKTSKDALLVDIIAEKRAFEDKVNPILSKAYQKQELVDYAQDIKNRVDNDKTISTYLDAQEINDIKNKCSDIENWVKSNPNATIATMKEKKNDAEAVIQPLIERAESHSSLRTMATNLINEVEELGDSISKQDKGKIQDSCKDTLNWLDKNKKASKRQVEAKRKELDDNVQSLLSGARLLKGLQNEIDEYRQKLKEDQKMNNFPDSAKKLINEKLDDLSKWIKQNSNAPLEEIVKRRNELKQFIADIIDKQDAHKDLRDYAEKVLKVLEHNKTVRRAMTEKDRQAAKDYAEDILDWLRRNPSAPAHEVREKKRLAVMAINALRGWKFEVPYVQFVGYNFSEQTRWGLAHNRINPWELNFGSYLKAEQRRVGNQPQKPSSSTTTPKFDSAYIPPWQATKFDNVSAGTKGKRTVQDEDEKKFEALKSNMVSPVLRAKLDSLTDTSGKSSKAASGPQFQPEISKFYSYMELKDKKSHELPPDVNPHKREQYLTDSEFEKVFGMSKSAFLAQPEFMQMKIKKEKGLFAYSYEC
jgi:hypothetical protein